MQGVHVSLVSLVHHCVGLSSPGPTALGGRREQALPWGPQVRGAAQAGVRKREARAPSSALKTGGKGPFFCSRERKEGARNTPGQSAVTRSRTEVAAATTQSTNHYTITARHRALRRHGALIFVLGVKRIRAVLHRLWRMQGFLFFTSSCPPTSFPSLPLSLSLF